ncbi:regulatory protein RecX [Chthonobacter rhizosphaerae]|uniref:regulatory protein RecX n=1 Tax=Chthonobacter rhizosphaerae TaxID=2735553 RepID=UPI0015EFBA9D|nr:RecX family transcriptional regulator [Chthonobacter rhizosphaerae]
MSDGEHTAGAAGEGASTADRDWLRRAALAYLERYASSEANLVRVLRRKIRRRATVTGRDIADPDALISEAIGACRRLGLLDDEAFVETKVASGARKGLSRRKMMAVLAAKGVDRDLAEAVVAREAPSERSAALAFARRRRLGPWRSPGRSGDDRAAKDIAALCRAGHGYGVARAVVSMTLEEAEARLADDPDADGM